MSRERENRLEKMILERLDNEILICDGAMGTTLYAQGCPSGESLEKWGVKHEEILRSVHRGYIESGADIIYTNTLGGSRIKLAKRALESETDALNQKLAEIAVEEAKTAPGTVYVAGDVGPTGEFMAPLGLLTEEDMYAAFAQQTIALRHGGVDLIIVETMMDVSEASVAIKAAKTETGLPVFASMSFNADKSGFRTMMGNSPDQAVEAMLDAGADVVGTNCGSLVISMMPDLVREIRDAGARHILVKPNAGMPEMIDGETVFSQTPEEMAAGIPAVLQAGANVVGGCCGTTPDHIKAIANAVEMFRRGTA